jgi:hypothetical protein
MDFNAQGQIFGQFYMRMNITYCYFFRYFHILTIDGGYMFSKNFSRISSKSQNHFLTLQNVSLCIVFSSHCEMF